MAKAGRPTKSKAQKKREQLEKEVQKSAPPLSLDFSSITKTKQSFAELLVSYYKREVPDKTYRGIVYGIQTYIGVLRLELEVDFENRISKLEKIIKNQQKKDQPLSLVK